MPFLEGHDTAWKLIKFDHANIKKDIAWTGDRNSGDHGILYHL